MTKSDDPSSESAKLSGKEEDEIEEHKPLRAAVIYEIIRVEGEGELARSIDALWWSGLAAGLTIGLSVVSQALLATYLPETGWKAVIEPLGYSVGFIVVIMARQQLFTENTLTAVLPVMKQKMQVKWLIVMLRLWAIVLVANLIGCLIFAATVYWTSMLPGEVVSSVLEIGGHLLANDPAEMFVKGIAAGWLIAALVWVIPSASPSRRASGRPWGRRRRVGPDVAMRQVESEEVRLVLGAADHHQRLAEARLGMHLP